MDMKSLMPTINIFVMSEPPEDKKKEDDEEGALSKALKSHGSKFDSILSTLEMIRSKTAANSHVGGG